MSTPTNHHYVSKCQLKEFFNSAEQKIYILNKNSGDIYAKRSVKRIMIEEFGNSKEEDSEIDHSSLEFQLKILFEDDYPKHVQKVEELARTGKITTEIYYSLYCLTVVGICGELRHPSLKDKLDATSYHIRSEIVNRVFGIPKDTTTHLQSKKKTPHKNLVDYVSIAIDVLAKLDPLEFSLYVIESDDHFILPDTSGFCVRGQLKIYPNKLFQEIIQVAVPITSKLFILATPTTLEAGNNNIIKIRENNSDVVSKINQDLKKFAIESVLSYNIETIEKLKTYV